MSAGVRLTIRLRFGIETHCLYFVGMEMGSVGKGWKVRVKKFHREIERGTGCVGFFFFFFFCTCTC
jgi:hypothetical protein